MRKTECGRQNPELGSPKCDDARRLCLRTLRSRLPIHLACALSAVLWFRADWVQAQAVSPQPGDEKKADAKQDDLAEKLIKQATGQSEDDVMKRIMDLMNDTGTRLSETADGGDGTQSMQRDIIKELDTAIEQALAQRRPKKNPKGGESSPDKRNLPEPGKPQGEAQAAGSEAAQPGAEPGATANAGANEQRAKLLGELLESRRSWGNLPDRDREEIIQGAQEEIVERYRPMIERYYQSLAESEDEP